MRTILIDGVEFVGYPEMSEMTGYSLQTLRSYKSLDRLPPEEHRDGNQPMWRKTTIEEWIKRWEIEKLR